MAEFQTGCPHCNAVLTVQEEWIGMNVECPECKKEFPIQKDSDTSKPAVPVSAESVQPDNSGTFTFVCPSCNTAAELPKKLLGQQYECQMCFETCIAREATEKQCPFCGQTIKYHATICKFCKADLSEPNRADPKTGCPDDPGHGSSSLPTAAKQFGVKLLHSTRKGLDFLSEAVKDNIHASSPSDQGNSADNTFFQAKLVSYANSMSIALFFAALACACWPAWILESFVSYERYAIITGAMFSLICYVCAKILEAYLFYEIINAIPKKRQTQNPVVSSLLILPPLWCIIWNFALLQIVDQLRNELSLQGKSAPRGLVVGVISHCIYSLLVPPFEILAIYCVAEGKINSGAGLFGSILGASLLALGAIFVHWGAFCLLIKAAAKVKQN